MALGRSAGGDATEPVDGKGLDSERREADAPSGAGEPFPAAPWSNGGEEGQLERAGPRPKGRGVSESGVSALHQGPDAPSAPALRLLGGAGPRQARRRSRFTVAPRRCRCAPGPGRTVEPLTGKFALA